MEQQKALSIYLYPFDWITIINSILVVPDYLDGEHSISKTKQLD